MKRVKHWRQTRLPLRVLLLSVALSVACATSCSSDDSRPPRIFGLSSQGPDSGVDAATDTGRSLGRALDVVNFFEAWAWETPLDTDALRRIADTGALPAVTWEPWNPQNGVVQDPFRPSRIAGGEFDDYIRSWARDAARYDSPLQIRFGHEMNGTWYPWAVGVGGNTAEDYVAAYRHVHDLFVAEGASKVQWVWSPDASSRREAGLDLAAAAYPGDTYVDVIGIDGYNGGAEGAFWQTPENLFGGMVDVVRTLSSSRPVWIYETGSGDELGDKAQWVSDLFAYLDGAGIDGLLWFDFAKEGEANWLLTTDPRVASAATEALTTW